MTLLEVEELKVQYNSDGNKVRAVDDVTFNINDQEIIGLLGESGCGKSTLADSIIQLLPSNAIIPSGSIKLDGQNILNMSEEDLRNIRWKKIAYIPQSAMGSLDPVYTIGQQLIETINAHEDMDKEKAHKRAKEVLDIVGINPSYLDDYPHQLSGGMKQRVILAMSLLLEPELIIADEPTTGLDVIIRDRILNDIERYKDEFGVSVLFVSHDVADLIETCDKLIVMYGGKIVEKGPAREVFEAPKHPYTLALKNSLPSLSSDITELIDMGIEPPDLKNPPSGCRFIEKCPFAVDECQTSHPPFEHVGSNIESACYRAHEWRQFNKEAKVVNWNE